VTGGKTQEQGDSMIHIAIVEDESLYLEQLLDHIETYKKESGQEIKVSTFRDGEDIVEKYKAGYDIILMDIQMRFMDGMTAAEKIRQMDQEVIIMFITNMSQYAVRGYEVDALYYILKPVHYFDFSQKLGRAIGRMKKREEHYIAIPVADGIQKIEVSTIYYIESQGHDLIYTTSNGEYKSKGRLSDLESTLEGYGFFRGNKGYLINMNHVEGMRKDNCLIGGMLIPVSRLRKSKFLEALAQYMSEVIK